MNVFDGKNPFADDSLWQIPIHLVRDSSASADMGPSSGAGRLSSSFLSTDDNMAKSATTEMSSADEHDDAMADNGNEYGDDEGAMGGLHKADSAPTVISASTAADLKTAAGYHHATPHQGYEPGHHHYGHGAAHNDHYGKYFQ